MSIKENFESHPVVFGLSLIFLGFISGFGVCSWINAKLGSPATHREYEDCNSQNSSTDKIQKLSHKLAIMKEKNKSLQYKIETISPQSDEKSIELQQTKPFLKDSLSITLKSTNVKPETDKPLSYSVDASIIVHGGPSNDIKDMNVGGIISLGNYQIIITSATRYTVKFKVISNGQSKCFVSDK